MNIVTKQFLDSLQKVGAQMTSPEAKKQVRDLYSKIETKETASTGGGGSYEGPLSGPKMSMWADEAPKKIQAKGGPVEEEKELEEIQKSWNGVGVAPVMTKRLEFMVKSVKGNRDPMNIRNFIENLPIKDSQDFRKYTTDNRPGINLIKKVIAPSGEEVQVTIGFGVEFFRPFFGL